MALTKREFVNNSKPPIDADFLNELQDAVIDLEENGGGGTGAVEITESDYENLTEEEKNADVLYMVEDGTPTPNKAENIEYDNTESGLEATTVQSAIDEVNDKFTNNTCELDYDNKVVLNSIIKDDGSTYTVPSNGVLQGVLRGTNDSFAYTITSKKLGFQIYAQSGGPALKYVDMNVFVTKGDVLTFAVSNLYAIAVFFVPFK